MPRSGLSRNTSFWILSGLLFVASLIVLWYYFAKDEMNMWGLMGAIFMLDLLVFVPASILTALLALVPVREKVYKQRFWARAPYVLSVATALGLVASTGLFWYSALVGFKQLTGVEYAAIATDQEDNCAKVHEGVFETSGMRIERHGHSQLQYNKTFGTTDELKVDWLSPCEYRLSDEDGNGLLIVKITHADDLGYDCTFTYSSGDGMSYSGHFDRIPN